MVLLETCTLVLMDDAKDIKKTDQLAKFLDDQSVRIRPFGRNLSGERAYARAERIVAALYLLSSHIPANEPTRLVVRDLGLQLLKSLISLKEEMRNANSEAAAAVFSLLRELISVIRLQAISGHVSIQNAEVMISAIDELGNFLQAAQKSPLSESIVFSKEDFLTSPQPLTRPGVRPRETISRTERELKDSTVRNELSDTSLVPERAIVKPRSQAILDILRAGGEMGIRFIAGHLPEYSEKMIQRELAGLIREGKVKKTGFKRWSAYSLA